MIDAVNEIGRSAVSQMRACRGIGNSVEAARAMGNVIRT
jgi:hypothetical protein